MSYKFFCFVCALNLFYYVPNLLASPVNPVIGSHQIDPSKYHVSIIYMRNIPEHFCSGVIIRDGFVLTAASCFMFKLNGDMISNVQPRSSNVVVAAGISEINIAGIIRKVDIVFIPYEFDSVGRDVFGNIAILQLEANLNVERHSSRLHILELDPGHGSASYEDKGALVPSYGCRSINRQANGEFVVRANEIAEIRSFIDVHMLKRNDCPYFEYSICAINRERPQLRLCVDRGSPLVYDNTIIGVLSRQDPFLNGMVFTRVWTYMSFINNAINGVHSGMHILNH